MIEGGITWPALGAAILGSVTVLGSVIGGLLYLVNRFKEMRELIAATDEKRAKSIKDETDKLHERVTNLRTEQQGFRTEVAKTYVSNTHLSALEERLTKSIDGLKDEIHNLVQLALQGNGKG